MQVMRFTFGPALLAEAFYELIKPEKDKKAIVNHMTLFGSHHRSYNS
jgi:hypothetical protein